jgi:hypothetical protein
MAAPITAHIIAPGHVSRHHQRHAARAPDLLRQGLQAIAPPGRHHDAGAFPRQGWAVAARSRPMP